MVKHCCKDMEDNLYYTNIDDICDDTKTDDCKVVYFSARFREYGLPVKDCEGIASSYILVEYCPWCGKKLPNSKRDEWFEKLEELGYDSPFEQEVPIEFQSENWYEKKTGIDSMSSSKTPK